MVLSLLVLVLSLGVDRVVGDPRTRLHPVALIGQFIGWWGRPALYPRWVQRGAGVIFWFITVTLFSAPFFLAAAYAPLILLLITGPFLLKSCFALRSLEEHALAVTQASSPDLGREQVRMLVSRDTRDLTDEQVLSAAYESVAENLTDSIIAPLLYFVLSGLGGAAVYRAANTMDAMLGYRDERLRLGWWPARMDDILSYVPARVTGFLLIIYFLCTGRLRPALAVFRRDRHLRPGWNGGIPMSLIAGGTGVVFEKPGQYRIGDGQRSLREAGPEIIRAVQGTTLLFVGLVICGSVLLNLISNV